MTAKPIAVTAMPEARTSVGYTCAASAYIVFPCQPFRGEEDLAAVQREMRFQVIDGLKHRLVEFARNHTLAQSFAEERGNYADGVADLALNRFRDVFPGQADSSGEFGFADASILAPWDRGDTLPYVSAKVKSGIANCVLVGPSARPELLFA